MSKYLRCKFTFLFTYSNFYIIVLAFWKNRIRRLTDENEKKDANIR